MLSNAYLLAKIGADAAENERNFAEILPKIGNYPTGPREQDDDRRGELVPGVARHALVLLRLHLSVLQISAERNRGLGSAKLGKLAIFFANFPIFWRTRSRLYRSQILQQSMRLKALAEIYTMHSFAQLGNLNVLLKGCLLFCKIQQLSAELHILNFLEGRTQAP